jgi:NADH:ubiquinone oxidoreductase subunit F (NADH-binding)
MPRLFVGDWPGLAEHQFRFGPPLSRRPGVELIPALVDAGLTGRGGAGFPTGRKVASVMGDTPVVVGNGAEGEPLSRKDAVLLTEAPHLVLDGLDAAAGAVGADEAYLYLHPDAVPVVSHAIGERRRAGIDSCQITVIEAADTFVAGEESAVVSRIEGGPALPRDRTVVISRSGVRGRPTLVNNVETLAHIALIARFGPRWFRSVGDPSDPGSMLVTLSGAVNAPRVIEVPTGAPLAELISLAGTTELGNLRAVLVGGYHGSWLTPKVFASARMSRASLAPVGATPGAGIVHALGAHECGLMATADIAAYLARQSARQCGPCLNGLPRLAQLLDELAYTTFDDTLLDEIHRMTTIIDGRGACRHPDGTARLVRSALHAFATDIEQHRRGRCEAALIPAPKSVYRHHELRTP